MVAFGRGADRGLGLSSGRELNSGQVGFLGRWPLPLLAELPSWKGASPFALTKLSLWEVAKGLASSWLEAIALLLPIWIHASAIL